MGKLIYGMIMSLDGYTEDAQGTFAFCAPDETVHSYINELASSVGTFLYGRRMYETMVFWETALTLPDEPPEIYEWARQWQAADKVVYSTTLGAARSAKTRIERSFDNDSVRRLKAESANDISVNGPTLAAHALRAGLVDEIQTIVCPVVVGGGTRFFPDGVQMRLKLFEQRQFDSGFVVSRYSVRSNDLDAQ